MEVALGLMVSFPFVRREGATRLLRFFDYRQAAEGRVSAAIEEGDEVLGDRRDRRLDETFMSTFAAIGALLLLDAGKADAALPDTTTRRPIDEPADPLRGAMASADAEASGPPAVSDSAFLEAIAALSPPPSVTTDWSSPTVGAAMPDAIAPPGGAPSAPPDDAANELTFILPGSISAIGSAQTLACSGGAPRKLEAENEAVFAIGHATIDVLSAAAAPSVLATVSLSGEPTPTIGGVNRPAQANGSSLPEGGIGATVANRTGPTTESLVPSSANSAALLDGAIVIDLSALFAFGAGAPGAFEIFAAQPSGSPFGGGDRIGFVSPDPWLTAAAAGKAEASDFVASSQVRLA